MPPAKKTFAGRYEKRTMGNYQIQYDTVLDHDTYNYLRVSFEVPRDEPDRAIVILNGKEIGDIYTVKNEAGKVIGFTAKRRPGTATPEIVADEPFKELGHAAAAIISNYVN